MNTTQGVRVPPSGVQWPASYVVWDLETTGLKRDEGEILEIGAMVVENGETVAEYSWLLDHDISIPPEATAIHGITNEMIKDKGRDPATCLSEFLSVLNVGINTHVTHNGYRFDIPWLVWHVTRLLELDETDGKILHEKLEFTMIDTAVLVKGDMLGLARRWNESMTRYAARVMDIMAKGVKYNVGYTCERMGIDASQVTTHRAGGDVYLTNEIYKKLISQ